MKNIIFDLGNVIIDIDFERTFKAFTEISENVNWRESERILKEKQIWSRYEKGQLTDAEFRAEIREELKISASDEQIDTAFCGLLMDIDPARIELIKKLATKYKIYILSNTSHIHFLEVERILERCAGVKHFSEIFDYVFLSYEMGKLKPEVDIYEEVLKQANLVASETLFLDDLLANLEGAATLGIQTKQIVPQEFTILDLFSNEV
ncbi:putative hydrolase of the HAD superfamily [Arcicella rosea]|uniref:HAD family hydrolase n=1 Tax=Arcicella rosea TaxID=502909 RepID=UPI00345C8324